MKDAKPLHLTYIPSNYREGSISDFTLKNSKVNIPKDSDFFILWNYDISTEKDLNILIENSLEGIPAQKLLTCHIKVARVNPKKDQLIVQQITAKVIPIAPMMKFLYRLDIRKSSVNLKDNTTIITWSYLTKLALEMVSRGNFIPILKEIEEKKYLSSWNVLLKTERDNQRFRKILESASFELFNLPTNCTLVNGEETCEAVWHPSYLMAEYLNALGDHLIRSMLNKKQLPTFKYYYSGQMEEEKSHRPTTWDYRFLKSLLTKQKQFRITKFHETIIPNILEDWTQVSLGLTLKGDLEFIIELKFPKHDGEDWPLNFYLKFSAKAPKISIKKIWSDIVVYKKEILKNFESIEEFMESTLKNYSTAISLFNPIKQSVDSESPHDIFLNSSEVMEFLSYPKDLLIQSGFNIILPEGFSSGGRHRLSTRLLIKSEALEEKRKKKGVGASLPSMFNVNSLLEYEWKASIEDEEITENELKELIATEEPLIRWRDDWILVDSQDMKELKGLLKEQGIAGKTNYMEALKMGLTGKIQLEEGGNEYKVVIEGALNQIIESLKSIDKIEEVNTPKSFNGQLRPYQKEALNWMATMCSLGFGLCLADDMGLGKTIEVISYLAYRKERGFEGSGSTLVICPTSVLFNWMREFKKFAPDLETVLHHGSDRIKDASGLKEFLTPHRVYITSYGTIRNDIDFLKSIPFSGVIVDESQNMKNYKSQQTEAIYQLQSAYRICLSGTPIENRLLELWSLFNFLNPGLLGERTEFQQKFVVPIERYQEKEAVDKLKAIIDPFILRRVKSDKSIIKDLPDKNEMDVFIDLTEVQRNLYNETVQNTLKEIEAVNTESSRKNGLVLKLLTNLKQICNHPHQFNKKKNIETLDAFIEESNKVERMLEIIEEIVLNEEKALIFTQFTQMGDLLKQVLEKKFDFPILYFHGGVPANKRREIVDEFQSKEEGSSQVLILSLKAGGTGLNLTQGTTVIHFDRWWNPAVEDQATDRAYRIGQKSTVNVYKFISVGTVEEKINALLEEKRDLADKIVVSSGEGWLSDLSFDKLKEIVSLN